MSFFERCTFERAHTVAPCDPFYSGPGDYTLFVLDGDVLLPRQVRLGECNYDYIEVVSGLEQGEQVVVSDMTKYKGKEKLKVQ